MENWRYRCQSITIDDNTNSFILETRSFLRLDGKVQPHTGRAYRR